MKNWWKSGDPWIWLTASSVSVSLIVVVGLISLIAVRGLGHFWPAAVAQATYVDERDGKSSVVVGEIRDEENVSAVRLRDSGVKVEGER
ncbi:MAG: hypothetical protein RIS84_227, partial [Pseudomonadota bacterium]